MRDKQTKLTDLNSDRQEKKFVSSDEELFMLEIPIDT